MALTKVTKELIQGGLGVDWQATVKTGNFQAVASQGYFVNTTSNQVIVTMPPTASVGDIVSIVDYAGTAQTNNITITAQSNINGSANDVQIDYQRGAVSIIYSGTIQGWVAEFAANDGTDALVNSPPSLSVDYLVVAGGGSGACLGGGGGAGGYRNSYNNEQSGGGASSESALTNLSFSTNYTVTVGAGGAATADATISTNGNDGFNSVFTSITSIGGGGASAHNNTLANIGGSGGGGSSSGNTSNGAAGTATQGYAGGNGQNAASGYPAGGGGGAGDVGGNGAGGNTSGNGGAGLASSITGSSVTRAGGGGGAGKPSILTPGTGAAGGGSGIATSPTNGTNAIASSGSGGGGGGYDSTYRGGGAGGSGIVILRYPTASVSSFAVTGTLDTVANTAYPISNTAYFKFNNDALDSSGNGYNGTAAAGTVTYSDGRFGKAAVFNGGTSSISLSSSPFTNTQDVSVSIWVKDVVAPSSGYGTIFVGDGNDYFYITVNPSGEIRTYIDNYQDPVYGRTSYQLDTINSNITDGNWHHIVVVSKLGSASPGGGGYEIYVDGTLNVSYSYSSTIRRDPGGSWTPTFGTYGTGVLAFNGKLDQTRIFTSAISAGNVTSLYNEGTVVESTDGTDSILQFIGGTGTITFS